MFVLSTGIVVAAPQYRLERSLLPEMTDTYYLGSTSPALEWQGGVFNNLTVTGTCTGCGGSGGAGTGWASSTDPTSIYFTGSGNVGIGTTTPYEKLSVDGRGVFNQDVRANYYTATSTSVASTFPYASTTALSAKKGYFGTTGIGPIEITDSSIHGTDALVFTSGVGMGFGSFDANYVYEFHGGALWSEGDILANSKVGIGTTAPSAKLSVEGSSLLGNSATAGYFTATTSTASTFPYASTTALSATSLCFTTDCRTSWGSVGSVYPFGLTGNATSTRTQFNGGLTSYASTTIGGGTQTTGLTINGGATTTGNAYFAGNVGIGTAAPSQLLDVNGGSIRVNSSGNGLVYLGSGGSYIGRTSSQYRLYSDGSPVVFSADGAIEDARITSSHFFGIGTTSPYAKLSVVGEVVAPYYTATSTTATSTFATGVRLNGRVTPTDFAEIFSARDYNSGGQDALYIYPPLSNGRIYFGRTGKTAYSLNFAGVTNIESFPNRLSQVASADASFCPYSTCASHVSASGDLVVAPGSIGASLTTNQRTWAGIKPSFMFKSYNYDDAFYRTSEPWAYNFDTASSSAKMTMLPHTLWRTGASTIMTLTADTGKLNVGSTTMATSTAARLSVTGTAGKAAFEVSSSTNASLLKVNEVGNTVLGGLIQLKGYTVATLPTCNAGTQGAKAYVTDALGPAFLVAVVGGGAVVSPTFCNGTAWVSE